MGGRGGGTGQGGGVGTGGRTGTGRRDRDRRLDRERDTRAVRHLRCRQHAVRGGVQHGPASLERIHRPALPGPESGDDRRTDGTGANMKTGRPRRRHHDGHRHGRRWLRRLGRAGYLLRHRHVHVLDHLRPVGQGQPPAGGARRLLHRRQREPGGLRVERQAEIGDARAVTRSTRSSPTRARAIATTPRPGSRWATMPQGVYEVADGRTPAPPVAGTSATSAKTIATARP